MPQTRDTIAVVTGHSRGLGAAIAAELLARDVHVLAVARHANAELRERYGNILTEVQLDLADAAALTAWLASDALESFLRAAERAVLVNNAGVLQPAGPLDVQDVEGIIRAVVVNVAAPLALSAAFVAATHDARDRRILHVSSGAARNASAGWSVYCATKAALDHHARAVALDRTAALRICSLAPGVIDTEMQAELRSISDDRFPDRQRYVDMKREGRLQNADLTGRAVVEFMLSEAFGDEPTADLRRSPSR